MKKKILALNILALSLPLSAQVLTTVADKAYMTVLPGTLVYNGGGLDVKGDGVLDIAGNVYVNGSSTDQFSTAKTGGNIVLRMNTADNKSYGQLAIVGLSNANVTGTVDKEFREATHGTYQQIAMPFNGKALSTFSTEFGKTFTDSRWTQNEILKWNNTRVRSDNFSVSGSTIGTGTDYIMLGSLGLNTTSNPITGIVNPNSATNTVATPYTNGVYVIRGKAVGDDNNVVRLFGAGQDVYFGTNGENRNYFGEVYSSYVQDQFVTTAWQGNFGKNLYQFGNPYFTNLDLSNIGRVEPGTVTDDVNLSGIVGIRFAPGSVKTDSDGATYSTGASIITYTGGKVPVGDLGAIVKPMQTFVIKLNNPAVNDNTLDFKFNKLRRFNSTYRADNADYDVTANKGANASTVKQLSVIALDASGNEMGRCYYVVYAGAKTGAPGENDVTAQATASPADIIGTYEENAINGGIDNDAASKYWLHINQADEDLFKGKAVAMNLYSKDVKSLKFEILENTKALSDNQSVLSSGKEFFIKKNGTTEYINLAQGAVLPVDGDQYSLFYDKSSITLGSTETKLSRTKLAYVPSSDKYVVLFDPKWSQADVKVFDASGKLVLSKSKVSTKENLVLDIVKTSGVYVVTAVSEKGEVFNSKLIR